MSIHAPDLRRVRDPARPLIAAIVAIVGIVAIAAMPAACADFEAPDDPTFGLPDELVASPSFTGDILPIFERRCATGGCHSTASHQAALVLTAEQAYAQTVNAPAVLRPGMDRVEPGNPDDSWLVRMIEADPARRDDYPRMPLASHPLSENQIANIRRWIELGAPQN